MEQQMDFFEHDKVNHGTEALKRIQQLCKDGFKQKGEIDVAKQALKKQEGKLALIMNELLPMLKDAGMSEFKVEGFGKVVVDNKLSVKVPKDPAEKQKFFDYLKQKDVFDSLATVHSATLNAFYNAELATAKEEGKSDFKIPGLEPSGEWTKLRFK